jgi:hypothetical protein
METKSVFNIPSDKAYWARLDAEAMVAYRAGQFAPHARVREWLARLAKGGRAAPPEA